MPNCRFCTSLLCNCYYYILQPHFLLIILMLSVPVSLQDSSQIGGISLACGNSLSSNSPPLGQTLSQYQLVGMDVLIKNVCSPLSTEPTTAYLPGSGYLVARCDECSKCPQELLHLNRALTQLAVNAKLSSLIIVVDKELERLRPSSSRPTPGNSPLVKFVFSSTSPSDDGGGGLLSLCDPNGDVLFVSISFIILIVISLAWLVFYYVQRFRYAHAKDRLQRRLFNAAKKALARIPTRPVKSGDRELNSDCPVCIDPYKPGDICRQLPCRHIFHKSCVDPWLLEHRTCPMCKSDILKAFGYHVSSRSRAQFSASVDDDIPSVVGGGRGNTSNNNNINNREGDRLSIESTCSDSANPFPVVTEVHDPFGFSPSTSPQFVQGFQTIPSSITTSILPSSSSVHCEIVQAQIERHSIVNDDLSPVSIEDEKEEKKESKKDEKTTENIQKRGESITISSAPIRLFRAVTGRKHVNTAFVRLSRSRSLNNQFPNDVEGKISNSNENGSNQAAIIFYSLRGNRNNIKNVVVDSSNSIIKIPTTTTEEEHCQASTSSSLSPVDESSDIPNKIKTNVENTSRALTAPGDFRRKKGGGIGGSGRTTGGTKRSKNFKNRQIQQHSLSDGDIEQRIDELNENKEIEKIFTKGGDVRVEMP